MMHSKNSILSINIKLIFSVTSKIRQSSRLMKKKTLVLSSSGLKNIVLTNGEDDFKFIIGDSECKISRIFADFISPRISRMHISDPTIDKFNVNDFLLKPNQSSDIFDHQLIENFKLMSAGYSIKIDKAEAIKLRILSIILENNEIFDLINKLFPIVKKNDDIDICLSYLPYISYFDCGFCNSSFNYQSLFDSVSSHFYSIDQTKLLQMPIHVLYSIISNKHLKLSSEDSLYDFINKIYENNEFDDENHIKKYEFYEFVDFSLLSERKFIDFIDDILLNEMTQTIWNKLKKCIHHFSSKKKFTSSHEKDNSRYANTNNKKSNDKQENVESYLFDGNRSNSFKGIIYHLGKGNPKSVIDNNIVNVTASSFISNGQTNQPQNIADFERNDFKFYSINEKNSWICYDFIDKKVKPSHYSIRSTSWSYNVDHLQNWCIEGSNNGKKWNVLSKIRNEKTLIFPNAYNSFQVDDYSCSNEYFRYIRLRQDGFNSGNDNVLGLSALELFGSVLIE